MNLNFSQLGLKGGPFNYYLKAVINYNNINENKFYTCLYEDKLKGKWFMSDGYTIQIIDNPLAFNNNFGDVIMLLYSSLN